MHLFLGTLLLGSIVAASPLPQELDIDMIDAAPQPTYTRAMGVASEIVTYDTRSIFAQATQVSSVTVDVANAASTDSSDNDESIQRRSACAPQPTGASGAPTYSPDQPSAFASASTFGAVASAAPVPTGYSQAFMNMNASNNAYGYLGFSTLETYDAHECAARCNKINGCMSVNIYFERSPSVEPGPNCMDPESVTMIKCAYWGSAIDKSNAVNEGQMRADFHVMIAGSNGYVNQSISTPSGYSAPTYLGNAAISAPYDSQGYNTYMGSKVFSAGAFNASLCAAFCSHQSRYNVAHPPNDGSPVQTCQFFNTYLVYINETSNVQGQYCAIYSESWSAKYATNKGQRRGHNYYKIDYSYSFSNSSNPGLANKEGAIYQARKEIKRNALQPYCSEMLGSSAAVVTSTVYATVTPITTVQATLTTSTTVTTKTFERRAATKTPAAMKKYPATVVSSACSAFVKPATSTSTVTVSATITERPSSTTVTVIETVTATAN